MLTPQCPIKTGAVLSESLLWPLNMFYSRHGQTMPQITPLFGRQVPQPYRELLVHHNDMTPTLEAYHEGTIHIERLHVMDGQAETSREVILRMDDDDKPVEYGASRVFLDQLNEEARRLVAEGILPLGKILAICDCPHAGSLGGFFRVAPMPIFDEAFAVPCDTSLYGRRNTLVAPGGEAIAEVCEIMPPPSLVT